MNKCFITKLPSSVDNDNLPVLGQLKINWLKQSDLKNNDSRAIGLRTNDSITVKVSGAHLTDKTLTSNLGNTKTITSANGSVWLYISNDADAILTIDNKYSLLSLNFSYDNNWSIPRSASLDIEDIRYCTNLTVLKLPRMQVSGDISVVSKFTNLTELDLYDTQVSGDISVLSKFTNLTYLRLSNTQVSGDINVLSNFTNLTELNLNNTQVSGDISALSKLTKLKYLPGLKGISLTGDMSKIPAKVSFIAQDGRKVSTNFTWTANGRKNATLLAMEGNIPFDTVSMDNMLIDQATCTVASSASTGYERTIAVFGTRTSASDAAVAAIQSMGVTIVGVTKQA